MFYWVGFMNKKAVGISSNVVVLQVWSADQQQQKRHRGTS